MALEREKGKEQTWLSQYKSSNICSLGHFNICWTQRLGTKKRKEKKRQSNIEPSQQDSFLVHFHPTMNSALFKLIR